MPLLGNIPTSPYRSQATAIRVPFRVSKKRQKIFFFLIFLTILTICLPYFCDIEERGAFPESCVSYKQLSCMQYMEVSHPQLLDPCIAFVFL